MNGRLSRTDNLPTSNSLPQTGKNKAKTLHKAEINQLYSYLSSRNEILDKEIASYQQRLQLDNNNTRSKLDELTREGFKSVDMQNISVYGSSVDPYPIDKKENQAANFPNESVSVDRLSSDESLFEKKISAMKYKEHDSYEKQAAETSRRRRMLKSLLQQVVDRCHDAGFTSDELIQLLLPDVPLKHLRQNLNRNISIPIEELLDVLEIDLQLTLSQAEVEVSFGALIHSEALN
jgi:hypothetical protein